ncbi:hypothetical protein [Acidithiobacillus thiooxidans]|nr:hypothetical protein [Acidithiobacillus thiooxidans]
MRAEITYNGYHHTAPGRGSHCALRTPMQCPQCKGPTHVLTSRFRAVKHSTNRRRACLQCGYRFTTIEIIIPAGVRADPEALRRGLPETETSEEPETTDATDATDSTEPE